MAERGSADSKTRFYPIYKNGYIVIMGLYTKGTKKRIFNSKFGIADDEKNITNTHHHPPPSRGCRPLDGAGELG